MIKEHSTHLLMEEAIDSNTSPERLAELSCHQDLRRFIAANSATPADKLASLSGSTDDAVCQAVAQNPNTPQKNLLQLAPRFPRAFLDNPVLPLLILSNPNFLDSLPEQTWLQLLRCDNVPLSLLQYLQRSPICMNRQGTQINPRLQSHLLLHVAMAGEVSERDGQATPQALQEYYQSVGPLAPHLSIMFWASSPGTPAQWLDQLDGMKREQKACFVRYHPGMTAELLDELVKREDVDIQRAVALHPLTSVSTLNRLVSAAAPAVRRAVASNQLLPASLLHQLVSDKDYYVRKAVATHPSASLADLAALACDSSRSVRAAVARHPQLSAELVQLLLHDPKYQVRVALASNAAVLPESLLVLAADPDLTVRQTVAGNPGLTASAFSLLLKDEGESMRLCLARNPQLPRDLLLQFVEDPSPKLRMEIAVNPQMSLPLLEELIPQGKLPWQGIARNPHMTPAMLTLMAGASRVSLVHHAIAMNERTPEAVLTQLSHKNDSALKAKIAAHPHTSLEVLKKLLASNNPQICRKVAVHPTINHYPTIFFAHLLNVLDGDKSSGQHPALLSLFLRHEGLALSHLQRFATSLYWPERYLVVLHPAVSPALLQDLSCDGNRYVRAAAREALARQAGTVLL